jgi:hypothetical protein
MTTVNGCTTFHIYNPSNPVVNNSTTSPIMGINLENNQYHRCPMWYQCAPGRN